MLFAVAIDGFLAASLLLGYGIAFSTAIVISQNGAGFVPTYVGDGLVFVLFAMVFIAVEPAFSWFRKALAEPRV